MKKKLEQQLSELIDGELDSPEREQLLAHLKKDPRLLRTWGRYHLVSDALRHNLPDRIMPNLAQRVQAALKTEPVMLVPANAADTVPHSAPKPDLIPSQQYKRFMPYALAASVAAVAVLGMQSLTRQGVDSPMTASLPAQTDTGGAARTVMAVNQSAPGHEFGVNTSDPFVNKQQVAQSILQTAPAATSSWMRIDPSSNPELTNYLFDHSEYSVSAGVRGMFPYARVVTYEVDGPK